VEEVTGPVGVGRSELGVGSHSGKIMMCGPGGMCCNVGGEILHCRE
jgi:hypothetical protein